MKAFLSLSHIVLLLVTVVTTIMPASVQAQKGSEMNKKMQHDVAIITRYDVRATHQKQLGQALHDYVGHANASQGNIMAEVYAEQDSPAVFWVIERWTSRNAYQRIRHAIPSKIVAGLAKDVLLKPASATFVVDLEPFPMQDWQKTSASDKESITIMLFVDAKPGTENNFKNVYHIAMPQFRSEQGVVNYQLSQFQDDKTRFVTYEKFRNEDAFQYHLNFPPIQPVIDYLNTSIRKQPFQLGLHRLKAYQPSGY